MQKFPNGWSERVYAGESFWHRRSGNTISLLGRGPSKGRGASIDRLRRLSQIQGFPFSALTCAQQVHGTSIIILGGEPTESAGPGDGLVSTFPGRGIAVWTADCVPVLFSGAGVVSAVHAGWRGVAAGIVPEAVEVLHRRFGVKPAAISATIGPAIGACHYPVGIDVVSALESRAPSNSLWLQPGGVDLRLFVHRQLLDLGLRESGVEIVGPCTACDPLLASFRRDGLAAGRQISVIGLAVV